MLKTGNNVEGSNVDMWPILTEFERKINKIFRIITSQTQIPTLYFQSMKQQY
jgi:hypothetical protein